MNAIDESTVKSSKVLFVDDESLVLFSLKRLFRQNKIDVDVETDSIKAIELIKENKYKVIVSDFRMPTMNGANFLEIVKELSPESIRIILSAQITPESVFDLVNKAEAHKLIQKPWSDKNLLEEVINSIERYDSANYEHNSKVTKDALESIEDHVASLPDSFITDILPLVDFDINDPKKYSNTLRNEIHQHLNYIINLTSSKIGNHCKRVSQLSLHFGKKIKLEEQKIKNLYYASLYHDIGKLFELVAQADHAELGANLLGQFNETKEAALIVRDHHKRLDDKSAGEISQEARILAIVDHFDKEVTKEFDREVDEKPRTLVDIISEMEKFINLKFDSELMGQFKEMILEEFKLTSFFNEDKMFITDLREGMVLSRPLMNVQGKMLLNSEYLLTKEVIGRLIRHNQVIPVVNAIYVYNKPPEKAFNYEDQIAKKVAKDTI